MLMPTANSDSSKESTKNFIYIPANVIESFTDSMTLAVYLKYHSGQWIFPEAKKALEERVTEILLRIPSHLLRDLSYPDNDNDNDGPAQAPVPNPTPNPDLDSLEDRIVSDCHSRLSHGASRCSCGNHVEYLELVEV